MTKPRPSTSAIFHYATDLRRAMLAEYRVLQEAEIAAAEEATRGVLVNDRGRALGLDSWGVFFGPPFVVQAYGSPELLEYLRTAPRTTRTAFEAQWLIDNTGSQET